MKNALIANNGSIQSIEGIPQEIKEMYRTIWEIKQRSIIDMSADRGAYIDQSQSLNLFMEEPNYAKMTSMHFYAWEKGLKTGMYYFRTRPAVDPIKFTVDFEKAKMANMLVQQQKEGKAAAAVAAAQPEIFAMAEQVQAPSPEATKGAASAEDQLSCSLDNPEGCEMCGS